MRCATGQGTVEYLAVVLLVAVVLGGTATAAGVGPLGARIATAVPHRVLYGICRVTGGDCDRDRAPCDVGSQTATNEWSVAVTVLTGGRRRILVREHRSDGRVVVTETVAPLGGLKATAGRGARLRLGGRTLTVGGEATAALVAAYGRGRTWVLDGDRAADALVAALGAGDAVPAPDQRVREADVALDGTIARGGDRVGGSATVGVQGAVGLRTDRATGARTYYFEGGVGADAQVSLRAIRSATAAAGADRERYALTVGADRRWLDLAIVRTGEVSATVTLPRTLQPVADALNAPSGGGRRWVAETHLDLSDPDNQAAARAFVDLLAAVPPRPAALARARATLAARLDAHGIVDVRTYAIARAATGVDVHVGGVLGVGGGVQDTTEHTRLIAATTRGLDGQWRRRQDCLKEVRA
jgi:hypothetical protein